MKSPWLLELRKPPAWGEAASLGREASGRRRAHQWDLLRPILGWRSNPHIEGNPDRALKPEKPSIPSIDSKSRIGTKKAGPRGSAFFVCREWRRAATAPSKSAA